MQFQSPAVCYLHEPSLLSQQSAMRVVSSFVEQGRTFRQADCAACAAAAPAPAGMQFLSRTSSARKVTSPASEPSCQAAAGHRVGTQVACSWVAAVHSLGAHRGHLTQGGREG